MIEEKKNVQKLTDEELDQVAGGDCSQNASICQAILNNKELSGNLDKYDRTLLDRYAKGYYGAQSAMDIVSNIVSNNLHISFFADDYAESYGEKNGERINVKKLVKAINRYKRA